ncbi:PfkB family carbohydrate kinase [Streptomyces puniciscabiei]
MNTQHSGPAGLFVGLATIDVIHAVDRMPAPNEKVTATAQALAAGGPAANAAVTFAHRGGSATLVTAIGRHRLTEIIRSDLAEHGVRILDGSPGRDEPPAVSSIAVSGGSGDRAVIAHYTGTSDIDVPDGLDAVVESCDVVLMDGHHPPLARAAAEAARRLDRRTVLDGGRWRPSCEALLPHVDVAVCSADFRPPGCRTDSDVFGYLAAYGVRWAAVTHGEAPIAWRGPDGSGEVRVPVVEVVDTLGAGDVFHGSLCHQFASRAGSEDADWFTSSLARAAVDASLSCASFGSRAWLRETPARAAGSA